MSLGVLLFDCNLLGGDRLLLLLLAAMFRDDVQSVEEQVRKADAECGNAHDTERHPGPVRFHQETSNEATESST